MNESKFLGISFRAWLALIVIATVCGMSCMGKKIEEPLYSLVLIISGAYFGKTQGQQNGINGNGEKTNGK